MGFLRKHGITIVVAMATAAVTATAPAVARSVVDFARNAGKVDGYRARAFTDKPNERRTSLVSTDDSGYLPSNIIGSIAPVAEDSHHFEGLGKDAYVQQCMTGALLGEALVPSDMSSDPTAVHGFSTQYGGPPSGGAGGGPCHIGEARAQHVSTGIYRVYLALIGCSSYVTRPVAGVLLSIEGEAGQDLHATYKDACEPDGWIEVHIFDGLGAPQDASFTIALLQNHGAPIP
jgi:hypothetical protein